MSTQFRYNWTPTPARRRTVLEYALRAGWGLVGFLAIVLAALVFGAWS